MNKNVQTNSVKNEEGEPIIKGKYSYDMLIPGLRNEKAAQAMTNSIDPRKPNTVTNPIPRCDNPYISFIRRRNRLEELIKKFD